jgi:chromosome segregation ATPase
MTNKELHMTPLIEELVESLRNIAAEGIEVNLNNLIKRNPKHSRRDYYLALDEYKKEQNLISSCKQPIPEQIRKRSEALFQQSWAIISNFFEEQLNKEKLSMEESIKEARCARNTAFDENESLTESNEKLKDQILQLQQELQYIKESKEKLETNKRELEFALKELQCRNEEQERTISIMKEMIDKLKS